MRDSREVDLNLIQLQKVTDIDKSKAAQIFVNFNRQRLFNQSVYHAKLILLY